MRGKYNLIILTTLMTAIIFLFAEVGIDWKFKSAIGRIPIFCMGIVAFYELLKEHKNGSVYYSLLSFPLLILSFFLLISNTLMQEYILVYAIAPFMLYLLGFVIKKFASSASSILWSKVKLVGRYSLEIYVANVIAMNIAINYELNSLVFMFVCIIGTIAISPIVIGINKVTMKYLIS